MIRSEFFRIEELVPKDTFKSLGDGAWKLFDPRVLKGIDLIRSEWGLPLNANDYVFGGRSQYRGWRPMDCKTGVKNSAHKYGLAVDLVPKSDVESLWELVYNSAAIHGATEIEALELTPSWVHVSWRGSGVLRVIR
jgi:hypothetical protein